MQNRFPLKCQYLASSRTDALPAHPSIPCSFSRHTHKTSHWKNCMCFPFCPIVKSERKVVLSYGGDGPLAYSCTCYWITCSIILKKFKYKNLTIIYKGLSACTYMHMKLELLWDWLTVLTGNPITQKSGFILVTWTSATSLNMFLIKMLSLMELKMKNLTVIVYSAMICSTPCFLYSW